MSRSTHRQPPRSPSPTASSEEYSDQYSENQAVSLPPPAAPLLSPARWDRPATHPIFREPKHANVDQHADQIPSQVEGSNAAPTARSNHGNRDKEIVNHIHNPTRGRHISTALDSNNLPSVRRERNIPDPPWVTDGSSASVPASGPLALSASGSASASAQTHRLKQTRHIPIRVLDGRKQQYTIPEWEGNRQRGWVESSRDVVAVGDARMVEHWVQERAEELARRRDTRLAGPIPHNLSQSSATREPPRSQPEGHITALQSRGRTLNPPRYKRKRVSPVAASFHKRKRTLPPKSPITRPRREGGGDSEINTRPIAPPSKYTCREEEKETSTSDAESVASVDEDAPNTPLASVRLECGDESDSEEQEVVSERENEKLQAVLMSLERGRAARRLVQTNKGKGKEKEKELSRPGGVINPRYTPPGYLRSPITSSPGGDQQAICSDPNCAEHSLHTEPTPSGSGNHQQNVRSRMARDRNRNHRDPQRYLQENRELTGRELIPEQDYRHPFFRKRQPSIQEHQAVHRPPETMPSRHRAYTLASSTLPAQAQTRTQSNQDIPDNEYSGRPGAQSSRNSTESNHHDVQRSGGILSSAHTRSRSFPNEVYHSSFFDDLGFHRPPKRTYPSTVSQGQPSNFSPLRNEYTNSELSSAVTSPKLAGSLNYTYTSSESDSPSSRPSRSKRVRTQLLPVQKAPTIQDEQPPNLSSTTAARVAPQRRHPPLPSSRVRSGQNASMQDFNSRGTISVNTPSRNANYLNGTQIVLKPLRMGHNNEVSLQNFLIGLGTDGTRVGGSVYQAVKRTPAPLPPQAPLPQPGPSRRKQNQSICPVPEAGGMGIIQLNIIPQPAYPHDAEGGLVRGVLRPDGGVKRTRRRLPVAAKVTDETDTVDLETLVEEEDEIDELVDDN